MSRQRRTGRVDEITQGLLLVDKPRDMTSHDVCQIVRNRLRLKKVGHGGTLDPFATGLLPLLLNGATKLMPSLQGKDKAYSATIQFGARTDTLDPTGEVLATGDPSKLTEGAVRNCLEGFVGEQEQRIPRYSAARVAGKRLYEYARQGEQVETPSKRVVIHAIELLQFRPESAQADIRMRCGSGTYVRTLADDVGERLGCWAHLASLRREQVGRFSVDDALAVEAIKAEGARRKAERDDSGPQGEPPRFDPVENAASWRSFFGGALRPLREVLDLPTVGVPASMQQGINSARPIRKAELGRLDPGLPEVFGAEDGFVAEDEAGERALGVLRTTCTSEGLQRRAPSDVVLVVERVLR